MSLYSGSTTALSDGPAFASMIRDRREFDRPTYRGLYDGTWDETSQNKVALW
jgi:hypothetical protein